MAERGGGTSRTHGNEVSPFQGGPPLLLDGGLATALEAKGFDLDDPLWSAHLLLSAPEAIREVHRDYLSAGADCIATVSYQASLPGFAQRGIDRDEGLALLRRCSTLAVEARDAFWSVPAHREGRRRPLVAASVGPFGAFRCDGSEYTGAYGVGRDQLMAFHRERWHLFAEGPTDLLACETIPSALEAEVFLDLLRETPDTRAWISFSCPDGAHISDGTPIAEVARRCSEVDNLVAVGVNCTKPRFVTSLLRELRSGTTKPLIAYPNAGEDYDIRSRRWVESRAGADHGGVAASAREWLRAGAAGVGGCCRVGPDDIEALRTILDG